MIRLLPAVVWLLLAAPAGAVDVSNLSDVENDPCVLALTARNAAEHVDAPDSALADACEGAHGNVAVAWEHLTRTWRPPDVSGAGYAVPLGAGAILFAALAVLLATVVLATVPRAAARLRGGGTRWSVEAALVVVFRAIVGLALLAALTLPGAPIVAALLVVVAIVARLRPAPPWPAPTPAAAWAEIVAGVVNDVIAAAPGLLAVALCARGVWWLLVLGVLLPVGLAPPSGLPGLARVRRLGLGFALIAAVLAAVVGWLGLRDRAFAAGPTVSGLVPVLLAGIVLWRAGLAGRVRVRRRDQRAAEVVGVQPDPAGIAGGELLRDPGKAGGA